VAFAGILLNHETSCVREFVELDESAARAGKISDHFGIGAAHGSDED
jgi:hypothetical protein